MWINVLLLARIFMQLYFFFNKDIHLGMPGVAFHSWCFGIYAIIQAPVRLYFSVKPVFFNGRMDNGTLSFSI